jgi:hypothetical protein
LRPEDRITMRLASSGSVGRVSSLVLALVLGAGCSSRDAGSAAGSEAPSDATGVLSAQLILPGGEHISSVSWTLANAFHTYSGTVDVSNSSTASFVIGNVAAGDNYTLSLMAVSDDGSVTCSGSQTGISVAGRQSSAANVPLVCTTPSDAGSVLLNGVTSSCPVWNTIVANPTSALTIPPNNQVTLYANAQSPNPAGLAFSWVTPAGTVSGTTNDGAGNGTATFTCPSTPGPVTISMTVSDGPLPDGGSCPASYTTGTVIVSCVQCFSASDCPASGTTCAVPACNSGVCGFTDLPPGSACADHGGTICNGAGQCVPPTIAVVRIGDGTVVPAMTQSQPVFLDQYQLTGTVSGSVRLPMVASGANQPFTLSPGYMGDGALSTSVNGRYLILAGYATPPGNADPVVGGYPRIVARVDASGNADTSSTLASSAFFQVPVRSAVSVDGSAFWAGGLDMASGGTWYVSLGATGGTQINASPVRVLSIVGAQLYGSGETSNPLAIFAIGAGLPTSGPATETEFPGLPISDGLLSPYAFALLDQNPAVPGPDTLYIASSRGTTGVANGLQKWVLTPGADGGTPSWTQSTTFNLATQVGFRGVVALPSAGSVTLVASTFEANDPATPNHLVVFHDNGSTSIGTTIATAPANSIFRGVSLWPHP